MLLPKPRLARVRRIVVASPVRHVVLSPTLNPACAERLGRAYSIGYLHQRSVGYLDEFSLYVTSFGILDPTGSRSKFVQILMAFPVYEIEESDDFAATGFVGAMYKFQASSTLPPNPNMPPPFKLFPAIDQGHTS